MSYYVIKLPDYVLDTIKVEGWVSDDIENLYNNARSSLVPHRHKTSGFHIFSSYIELYQFIIENELYLVNKTSSISKTHKSFSLSKITTGKDGWKWECKSYPSMEECDKERNEYWYKLFDHEPNNVLAFNSAELAREAFMKMDDSHPAKEKLDRLLNG